MHKDLVKKIESSFLSCEKDIDLILNKLFYTSKEYSNTLKKLLMINQKDCLDNPKYTSAVEKITPKDLKDQNYIRLIPRIQMGEEEEKKNYVILTFDNFSLNMENPEFRDCTIHFDIICHTDSWDLGDYRIRPLKIAGYIDGLLNNQRITGIGTLNFVGCNLLLLNEELCGYTLVYKAIHGSDDRIPTK